MAAAKKRPTRQREIDILHIVSSQVLVHQNLCQNYQSLTFWAVLSILVISICRQYVAPFELNKVIVVVCLIWLYMFFRVGIAKTIMVHSLVILILVITAPDIFSKSSSSAILKNFPNRARETLGK
jgi:hypothetical protein